MKRRRSGNVSSNDTAAGEAGLTLLEVLFSIAILGMGLAIIVQGFALSHRVTRESAAMREMSLVASNALNLLLSRGEAPSSVEEGRQGEYTLLLVPELSAAGEGEEGEEGEERMLLRIVVERPSGRSLEVVTAFPAEEGS